MLDDLHQPERGIAITFILPTRNRREWVGRAIDSCLAVAGPAAAVEVLVVDGRSTDGSFEALGRLYGADPRVRLIRQGAGGDFMDACFSAIPLVRTPFATFMYDDDVLSPRWAEMPLDLLDGRARFAMGKGEVGDVAATLVFPTVVRRISVDPASLLRSYCGCHPRSGRLGLPVSPICCLTLTARLTEWVNEVRRFTAGRPLREYYLLKRNAGPDLMVYLLSLVEHEGDVSLFDGTIAQFSSHADSMTIQFERTDLEIGYWLPLVWLCDALRKRGRHREAGLCGAYAVKAGLRRIRQRIGRGRWAWLLELLGEVAGLGVRSLGSRSGPAFLKTLALLLLPRGWRPDLNPLRP